MSQAAIQKGIQLGMAGRLDKAITVFEHILVTDPEYVEAHANLGTAYHKLGKLEQALDCYEAVLELDSHYPATHYHLGVVHKELGNLDLAIDHYEQELKIDPNHVESMNNLANILISQHNRTDARDYLLKALELKPDYAEALANLEWLLREVCDWESLPAYAEKLDALTMAQLKRGHKTTEHPFANIVRHADPGHTVAVAETWSRYYEARPRIDPRPRKRRQTITLGYLSGDFRDHPVAHLLGRIFSYHNRSRFRVHVYSYGPDDGSVYRTWASHDADSFADVRIMTDGAVAQKISKDGVDILIDLHGYTKGFRAGILAYKPAPIHVSWLGFPGSMGADFIDYILADVTVLPKQEASMHYSETPIYLPHCYQITDDQQEISARVTTREEHGLPDIGFVFGSFCQTYKITQAVFDVWMRLLQQLPTSILWLYALDDLARRNLERYATSKGIDVSRIVFAEHMPKPEHLERIRHCDLMLDTYPYNGHTTTTDALWAGVPVLSVRGKHFASRVAESILSTIGLPELVAVDMETYEAVAHDLAKRGTGTLKRKLKHVKPTSPLFDSKQFVKDLEAIYTTIYTEHTS